MFHNEVLSSVEHSLEQSSPNNILGEQAVDVNYTASNESLSIESGYIAGSAYVQSSSHVYEEQFTEYAPDIYSDSYIVEDWSQVVPIYYPIPTYYQLYNAVSAVENYGTTYYNYYQFAVPLYCFSPEVPTENITSSDVSDPDEFNKEIFENVNEDSFSSEVTTENISSSDVTSVSDPDDFSNEIFVNVNDDRKLHLKDHMPEVDVKPEILEKDEDVDISEEDEYVEILQEDEDVKILEEGEYMEISEEDEYVEILQVDEDVEISEEEYVEILQEDEDVEISEEDEYVEILQEDEDVEILEEDEYIEISEEDEYVEILQVDEGVEISEEDEYVEILQVDEDVEISEEDEYVEVLQVDEDVEISEEDEYVEILEEDEDVEISQEDEYVEILQVDEDVEISEEDEYVEILQVDEDVEISEEDEYVAILQEDEDVEISQEDEDVEISQEDEDVEISEKDEDVEISQEDVDVEILQEILESGDCLEKELWTDVIPEIDKSDGNQKNLNKDAVESSYNNGTHKEKSQANGEENDIWNDFFCSIDDPVFGIEACFDNSYEKEPCDNDLDRKNFNLSSTNGKTFMILTRLGKQIEILPTIEEEEEAVVKSEKLHIMTEILPVKINNENIKSLEESCLESEQQNGEKMENNCGLPEATEEVDTSEKPKKKKFQIIRRFFSELRSCFRKSKDPPG